MKKTISYRFVDYFLKNRQLTVMLLVFVVLGGLFGFTQLNTEGFPTIPVPVIVVNTVLPGAGPETIAEVVTTPLESELSDLKGLSEYSSSSRNNVSTIILLLDSTDDINNVLQDVRSRIDSVTLPESALDPTALVLEAGLPPIIYGVTSPEYLGDLLEKSESIAKEFESIDGITSIDRFSDIENRFYVELQPQFQNPDIYNQINAGNIAFPLGSTSIDNKDVPIAGTKVIDTLDDIRTLPITITNRFGGQSVVELQDIANVYTELDFGTQIHRVGYNDDEDQFVFQGAILYAVSAKEGIDVLKLDDRFQERIEEVTAEHPELDIITVWNQAEDSRRQISEITEGAFGSSWDFPGGFIGYVFGGIWLLTIVMLIFVDWRSAIISIITIPLAFLFTFGFLYTIDVQLNTMVLFSLVLVLGLVIDPAIVVLESIKRYTEIGYRGADAALRAATAVGKGVFVAVFTSFIVFVPFALVGGTLGEFVKFIPLTVIPALVASYFVPMVFLMWLGVKFLKPKPNQEILDEDDVSNLWPVARLVIRINRAVLRRRWTQVVVVVVAFGLSFGVMFGLLQAEQLKPVFFSEPEDNPFLSISVPLPVNSTNEDRLTVARQTESIIAEQGEYIRTAAYFSFEGPQFADARSLSYLVELWQPGDRDKGSKAIVEDIREALVANFGERARVAEASGGPPQDLYPVGVEIFNTDATKIKRAAELVAQELRNTEKYPEVEAVTYEGEETTTELTVQLDELAVARAGLSAPAVYGQVASILGENELFIIGDTEVIARYPLNDKPASVQELEDVLIFGPQGPVRLGNLGQVVEATVPGVIGRVNGEQTIRVGARVKDVGDVVPVQAKIDEWAQDNLELLGLTERDLEDRAGLDEFTESFIQLGVITVASIAVTYVIFVVFFGSFLQPLIILGAVPLILLGAIPALVVFAGGQFGFLEGLGVIILIGIVENVAIFMIDFANQRVERGMDKKEAIALSSGIRFRPILLTQLTSFAGLLPLAVAPTFWRGLAVVVIAGIVSSGIFALFTTPVLYNWFTRQRQSASRGSYNFVHEQPHYEEPEQENASHEAVLDQEIKALHNLHSH